MSGSLTVERAEEMQRELIEALLAVVKDDTVPVPERLAVAQEVGHQLGHVLRPQPESMPTSFPGNGMP